MIECKHSFASYQAPYGESQRCVNCGVTSDQYVQGPRAISPPSIEPIEVTGDTVYVVNEGGSGLRIRVTEIMVDAALDIWIGSQWRDQESASEWRSDMRELLIAALSARG